MTKYDPLERETRSCSGEDLKCALMLGVPGIIALIIILSIIFVCRSVLMPIKRQVPGGGRLCLNDYIQKRYCNLYLNTVALFPISHVILLPV